MSSVFYYEDKQDNFYNEQGLKAYDPMKDILTKVNDSNIVLETMTNQKNQFAQKPLEKLVVDKLTSDAKSKGCTTKVSVYTNYIDREREQFIDSMTECSQQTGTTAKIA